MNEPIPRFESTDHPVRPDAPTVERETINAIIINPKTNEVLCLDWTTYGWRSFIIGGIENDEDMVTAALREIKEESGYTNLKFIAAVAKGVSVFYAPHKNVNRISNDTALLFELVDDSRETVEKSEQSLHEAKWIPKDEVPTFLNLEPPQYYWKKALEYIK